MKTILFLLLIYSTQIFATNSNQEKSTSSFNQNEKKTLYIKLRQVLNEIKEYKTKHEIEKKRVIQELSSIKKNFNDYKLEKENEIKKLKRELYLSQQNLNNKPVINHIKNNKLSQELNMIKNKFHNYKIERNQEFKKLKRECSIHREKREKEVKKLKNELHFNTNKQTNIHKVIKEMKPTALILHKTPWIEITVEDNMNIYDLALKYYGDSQEYRKIYRANQNIINHNYQINNGMTLIIPISGNFREQPIVLNTN